MSNLTDFLGRAIGIVKQAVDADNAKEYQKALNLYTSAIENFILAAKWEKNAKSKEMIRGKAAEYMDRAEKLKTYLMEETSKKDGDSAANSGKKEKANGGTDDDSQKLRNALLSVVMTTKPNIKWEDVAGLEDAKQVLQEAVILPKLYPNMFGGKRQPWRGILLYGPPGTGKTHLAKAVATEAGGTFYSVKSSDLVSKWMGESEK
jgi:vacuolar protein-sorting-associated protein 4